MAWKSEYYQGFREFLASLQYTRKWKTANASKIVPPPRRARVFDDDFRQSELRSCNFMIEPLDQDHRDYTQKLHIDWFHVTSKRPC